MARRALLVGINDYQGISDLRGCVNDVRNMWNILQSYMGFRNDDIRVLLDRRATKENILHRLRWMVSASSPGDILVFHFSGHGSQIRDRDGDDLKDRLDELLCPWDMDWDATYILDDDLETILGGAPDGVRLEVFLDCCHSGWDTGPFNRRMRDITFNRALDLREESPFDLPETRPRYLEPPEDIRFRWLGQEDLLRSTRRFTAETRSTARHTIWAGCRPDQTSADAYIDGNHHGAFTYHYCMHMRETEGNISRVELLDRIRASLRAKNYSQVPQMETGDPEAPGKRSLQFPELGENERLLFLTTPNMRGDDVVHVQQALKTAGHDIKTDGIFGPFTRIIVMRYQKQQGLLPDGVVGPAVRSSLFG